MTQTGVLALGLILGLVLVGHGLVGDLSGLSVSDALLLLALVEEGEVDGLEGDDSDEDTEDSQDGLQSGVIVFRG